ncbi:D-alanyl-D-alanine carboxypeptidase [Streptomyces sp. JJ36]|nr:D-alanyl-D-alanine carboxypeptidase [Streptomyces sp. JJ36]
MAGESPDKSEQGRSSGETQEDTRAVPSGMEDPRAALRADAERPRGTADADEDTGDSGAADGPEGAGAPGDARLRAAVAAWVAGDAPPEGAEPPAGAAETSGDAARDQDASDAAEASDASGESGAASSDLPVRRRPEPAAEDDTPAGAPGGQKPGEGPDTSTTLFGVERPGEPGAGEGGEETAQRRAERMTSAFFGASRTATPNPASGDPDTPDDASPETPETPDGASPETPETPEDASPGASASASAESSEPEPGGAEPSAEGGAEPSPGASGPTGAPDDEEPSGRTGAASGVDQATAVFRTPKPDAAGAAGGRSGSEDPAEPGAGSGTSDEASPGASGSAESSESEPGGAEPSGGTGSASGVDQATAVFRAPKPGAAERGEAGGGDQPTTAIRLPRDRDTADTPDRAEAAGPASPGAAASADTDAAPSTSRFVPLQSADDAPRHPAGSRSTTRAGGTASGAAASRTGQSSADAPAPADAPDPADADPPLEPTAQQPVPDPPPLDLLAQLTNKPAPPETPLRTVVRRVKIWTPLVLLLVLVFAAAQMLRPLPDPSLELTAAASHSFEGEQPSLPWPTEGQAVVEVSGLGRLGSSGEPEAVPIGSVAKTMTAYVVLRDHPLKKGESGPRITVDQRAEEEGKRGEGNGNESVLDTVQAGDKLSLKDALSALMVPSANNIARLLARWHSDSEEAFVEEMNATAEELGMTNTTYTDPSGLEESTVSTAADQVKLGKKAMEIPALVDITVLPQWTDPSGRKWRNWNTLVPYDGAIGIKTGTTTAAGGNLLFAGRKKVGGTTQLIVGAVLGQHKPPIIDTVNAVSRELLKAAGEVLTARTVIEKGQVVGEVDDGLGGRTSVVATEDVTAVGWPGMRTRVSLEEDEDGVPHEATAGERVGVLTAGEGPGQVRVPVALATDLEEPGFGARLTRVL